LLGDVCVRSMPTTLLAPGPERGEPLTHSLCSALDRRGTCLRSAVRDEGIGLGFRCEEGVKASTREKEMRKMQKEARFGLIIRPTQARVFR
jgi:hypothetical protein